VRHAGARPGREPRSRRQHRAEAEPDRLVGRARISQPHLGLGGMHVHVQIVGRHLEENQHRREAPVREHFAIGAQRGVGQLPVAHRPSVDEEPHRLCSAIRDVGRPCEAMGANAAHAGVEGSEAPAQLATERLLGARREGLARRQLQQGALPLAKREGDVQARHRQAQHRVQRVGQLGGRAFDELPPRRHIPEQIAHLDGGAARRSRVLDGDDAPAVDLDPRSGERALLAGEQDEARDRRDRGQRLAAKAIAADGEEVVLAAQLGGGVALQREPRVGALHAAAVVAHPNQLAPAVEEIDLHPLRTGIERVLHQLLHHRRRPLDHLARGDLVAQRLVEQVDARHATTLPVRPRPESRK